MSWHEWVPTVLVASVTTFAIRFGAMLATDAVARGRVIAAVGLIFPGSVMIVLTGYSVVLGGFGGHWWQIAAALILCLGIQWRTSNALIAIIAGIVCYGALYPL
ncbi:MAG: AzlD domain-containing protein [Nocardioides sp.]